MDYGFHPPTVYFPLVVPEALMIEPTESEAKETLDAFVEAMLAIAREAREDPDADPSAPHGRAVAPAGRGRAAKQPVVRFRFEEHVRPEGAGAGNSKPLFSPSSPPRKEPDARPTSTTSRRRSCPRRPGRSPACCTSLIEEAEAIDWYEQRLSLEKDREARRSWRTRSRRSSSTSP